MLNQKNKQFLIVWFTICLFALLCNVAPIEGEVQSEDFNNGKPRIHLLTNQGSGFWPFSTEFRDSRWWDNRDYVEYPWRKNGPLADADGNIRNDIPSEFNGIFNGFDYLEFLVYGIIGLAIVYFPKIWN
ncbi:hypothetical protein DYBT9623_05156 [Dyadobacter sp. CECT 9623]|uniref:Uncharacterized protein n=1 Tax=Dyadobacter linearis TaxID=2823330 RepID=A0ABM8UYN8_9BACT|nr:hypothetical protein [Dyadobacter sp. CECT 9623]CAG5074469.1 hypothetical protein DYBT9623_05156 [Dyadobacter sp. CECT 9623]